MAYSPIRTVRMAAANAKGRHTKQQWEALKRFFGNRCVGCFKRMAVNALEKDHIYPVALGGCNCIVNLQPLCSGCNARKGSKYSFDCRPWASRLLRLGEFTVLEHL